MSKYCNSRNNGYLCTRIDGHEGTHEAEGTSGKIWKTWPNEPINVVQRSRVERLKSLTTGGEISIETVARIFECPEASVRRDIQVLRKEGYYIVLDQKQIKNYGLRQALIAAADDVDGDDREEHF